MVVFYAETRSILAQWSLAEEVGQCVAGSSFLRRSRGVAKHWYMRGKKKPVNMWGKMFISWLWRPLWAIVTSRFNATDTVDTANETINVAIHPVSRLLIGSFIFRYPFPIKKKDTKYFFQIRFLSNFQIEYPTGRCVYGSKLCFVFCCQPRREAANHIDTRSTYAQVSSSASHALNRSSPLYVFPSR